MAAPAASSARFHPPFHARLPHSAWGVVVALCSLVLAVAVVGFGGAWIATSKTRVSAYAVTGSLSGIQLDVRSGNVQVLGGESSAVEVRRTDRYSFNHHSSETRSVAGGALRIRSSCPKVVVGHCSADYLVRVPDNVPVTVNAGSGSVHLAAFRGSANIRTGSGNVTVDAFCGFGLTVQTGSGDAHATTACSPQHLSLRSSSGSLEASVPPGRYQVDAESNGGKRRVSGVSEVADAPFAIQAVSRSGDVTVDGAP